VSEFALRPLRHDDRAFVASTWAFDTSQRSAVPWWYGATRAREGAWLSALRAHAGMAFEAARWSVLCSPDMPSVIMGWACARDGHVIAAYVRPRIRETRIGREWAEKMLAAAKEAKE
jgi:hypothetical protein